MRIGQTRHEDLAGEIDCARSVKFLGAFVRSNENDPIFANGDRFGMRLFFVNGVNISVNQKKIDIVVGARGQI
jgi:hypothetical protein